MRVLWVDHTGQMGGGQLNLDRYIRQPSALNHEILLLEDGPLADAAADAGVPCVVIPFDYTRPSTYGNLPAVRRRLRSTDHDIVVSNSLKSAMAVGIAGSRQIRHVSYVHQGMDWFSGPRRAFYAMTAERSVVAYLANSGWAAGTLPARVRSSKPLRVVSTLSGVEELLHDGTRDWAAEPLQVLSLSRFIPTKGIHTVVEAANLCREWGYGDSIHFSLVGAGVMGGDRYARSLRENVERQRSNVTFHPYTRDIRSVLASHHVLVHAATIPEAFGQVLMQGMAAGLVIVSTAYGGAAELFEDGYSGIRFHKDDAEGLARIIVGLHEDRARSAAMAGRGPAVAAVFEDKVVAQRIDEALTEFRALAPGNRSTRPGHQ